VSPFLLAIGFFFVLAAGPAAGGTLEEPGPDYPGLLDQLRSTGLSVEPEGEVDQPYFSVEGRLIQVGSEEVQVFQYPDTTAADKEAALVSPDGSTVGTSKLHWIAPPHFYKKGKLLVLYVGDDAQVLKALEAALGKPFAGK